MFSNAHKKAQAGILGAIFGLFIFFLVWVLAAMPYLQTYGSEIVAANEYTGVIAFILLNINIFIFFGFLIGMFILLGFGGRQ